MRYLLGFVFVAGGFVVFIQGMLGMSQYGNTNIAGAAFVAMLIGVVAVVSGVRLMGAAK